MSEHLFGFHRRTLLLSALGWVAANIGVFQLFKPWDDAEPSGDQIPQATLREFAPASVVLPGDGKVRRRIVAHYRLLKPKAPKPGRTYPVVLFLHGAGQVGLDNRSQLKHLPAQMAAEPWRSRYPCFLIAPQCPPGRSWLNEVDVLLAILERVLNEHPADPRRVYLTGLSMGGFGSWNLATLYPERFAAVVPICGGGNPALAARLLDVPIWAVHGDADTVVPVEQSRTMIDAIQNAGGSPRYTELRGVTHNSWTPAYRQPDGVIAWMFRQVNRRAGLSGRSPNTSPKSLDSAVQEKIASPESIETCD